ncbi:zinc finger protein RFP-like isoform X2 [Varanus komodoensis]|uniref:zinc finger protein RFP-like isoform X2 n=1 Tax=Varanus komodoensis TaxID=61221 RepID=UPI001CF7D38D|nr:zinc finger protein RFP-like isoform X2 [Varanus komodoensis]
MADAASIQTLCDEATCSVCLEYFKEPVIVSCGHTFCQDCITQCWAEADKDALCPQCREPCQRGSFRPSRQLASMVAVVKKFSLQQPRGAEALGGVCEKHQELLKLFCEDDRVLICVVCDKAKEHRQHKVIPKEEAFEEYKCKIQSDLKLLNEEKEKYVSAILKEQAEGKTLLEQTEREREKIVAEFEQLRKFLKEREEFLLAQLKDLDDQITDANNKYSSEYSDKISSIDSLIKEVEEKLKQSADEFLQDIRDILPRCEEKPWEYQKAFPPKLSEDIKKFSESRTSFETVVKDFRERLLTGRESMTIPTVTNPTNRTVAIPTVWLAVDDTVMKLVEQQRSQNSAFSNRNSAFPQQNSAFSYRKSALHCWTYLMGTERIASGSHSWEVDVPQERFWAVGVAREHLRDGCKYPLEGIWALGKFPDGSLSAFASCQLSQGPNPTSNVDTLFRVKDMPRKVRVSLNYENGTVTFLNAHNHTTIYKCCGDFSGDEISSWLSMGK